MAEFAYNIAKNANIGRTLFELNCGYHSCISYKKDLDRHLKLKTVKELSFKLQNHMAIDK